MRTLSRDLALLEGLHGMRLENPLVVFLWRRLLLQLNNQVLELALQVLVLRCKSLISDEQCLILVLIVILLHLHLCHLLSLLLIVVNKL